MATDASMQSTNTKRKKSFYAEEEDIVVKPSTELIPDEYQHISSDSVVFHIFRNHLEKNFVDELSQTLQDIDYKLSSQNLHDIITEKDLLKDLENIKSQSINKSALLLIFIGFFEENEKNGSLWMSEDKRSVSIKDIWNMFSANVCPELRNKPKIFIFCTSPKPVADVQVDSMRHRTMNFEKVYDFPAEADMLIVYKKDTSIMANNKWDFLYRFFENIKAYSKKHDIIDLLTYIENNNSVPLIISTLTRKFYLISSDKRDHYLSLFEIRDNLEDSLRKIEENVKKLHELQSKKKEKMFSFSFKKKSEDKPKISVKKKNTVEQVKTSTDFSSSTTARLSKSGATGSRSRNPSEADNVAGAPARVSTGSSTGNRLRNQGQNESVSTRQRWKF